MTFDAFGGGFTDNTCSIGSLNKYLIAKNPRQESGFISRQIGNRTTGLTYPRLSTFYRAAPAAATKTLTFSVTNQGASHYVFNGSDRLTTHVDAQDPTLNCNDGDILVFNVNVPGHPFYIKTAPTTGIGNQLPSYMGSGNGVTGNSFTSGTVTLYTEGLTGTTLYYICQFHGSMQGQIVIS